MSRRTVVFLLAGLLIVAGFSLLAAEQWIAPGHPTPGHEDIAHDCFACHQPLRGTPADRCVVCHDFKQVKPPPVNGVSSRLQPGTALLVLHRDFVGRECTSCHAGHLTREITSATPRFDHTMLSAGMRNECASCHRPPKDDMHLSMGTQCADCHRTSAWSPATFDHQRFFPLEGPHDTACKTCHISRDFRTYSCTGCHEHSPDRIAREHAEEGIRRFDDCVRCHRNGSEHGYDNEAEREHD